MRIVVFERWRNNIISDNEKFEGRIVSGFEPEQTRIDCRIYHRPEDAEADLDIE
ncbi:MAG: hypothetical protein ACOX3H_01035 [Saccharofermentanales bacterium]